MAARGEEKQKGQKLDFRRLESGVVVVVGKEVVMACK